MIKKIIFICLSLIAIGYFVEYIATSKLSSLLGSLSLLIPLSYILIQQDPAKSRKRPLSRLSYFLGLSLLCLFVFLMWLLWYLILEHSGGTVVDPHSV